MKKSSATNIANNLITIFCTTLVAVLGPTGTYLLFDRFINPCWNGSGECELNRVFMGTILMAISWIILALSLPAVFNKIVQSHHSPIFAIICCIVISIVLSISLFLLFL